MFYIDEDAFAFIDYPNLTGTPERRLLLAVLERAILDFVGNDVKERDDAEAWIFDTTADERIEYSFEWLCHQLDLESKQVRETIQKMPKRGTRRIAPWYFGAESAGTVA